VAREFLERRVGGGRVSRSVDASVELDAFVRDLPTLIELNFGLRDSRTAPVKRCRRPSRSFFHTLKRCPGIWMEQLNPHVQPNTVHFGIAREIGECYVGNAIALVTFPVKQSTVQRPGLPFAVP